MRKAVLTMVLMVGLSAPMLAHHPFASEYDWKKPATLTGTIAKVDWMAPHVRMMIDGRVDTNERANPATWNVELGSPNELTQLGWKVTQLKVGDKITIDGWLGYNDSNHMMNARSARLADGSELIAASSFFNLDVPAVASTSGVDAPKARSIEKVAAPATVK